MAERDEKFVDDHRLSDTGTIRKSVQVDEEVSVREMMPHSMSPVHRQRGLTDTSHSIDDLHTTSVVDIILTCGVEVFHQVPAADKVDNVVRKLTGHSGCLDEGERMRVHRTRPQALVMFS